MRQKDDGKMNRQQTQQQKQETCLLFAVAAVTVHLFYAILSIVFPVVFAVCPKR